MLSQSAEEENEQENTSAAFGCSPLHLRSCQNANNVSGLPCNGSSRLAEAGFWGSCARREKTNFAI